MNQSTESATRVVVDGRWEGNLIPSKVEEMEREVFLRPGAHVNGCVFGREVKIEGPVEVAKAVYATGSVQLVLSGDIRLRSALGAREIVTAVEGGHRLLIEGDVVGTTILLQHAVVRGSIMADEIRLHHCLVLGAVRAAGGAELDRSVALAVDGARVQFGEECGLLIPYARAKHALQLAAPVKLMLSSGENYLLYNQDIVESGGSLHLTAGRRGTDLARLAEEFRNLSNYLLRLTSGDALRCAEGDLSVQPDRLPGIFREMLPESL